MNLQNYVLDAIRTESRIDSVNVNIENLVAILNIFIASGNLLDDIKKNVFYNKPIQTEKWDYNNQELKKNISNISSGYELNDLNKTELSLDPRLFHALIGIATESTELMEAIVKTVQTGALIDHVNIREEIGDIGWYTAIAMDTTNSNWEQILKTNIEKLRKRYPEKFTSSHAIHRDLDAEREILEQK